MTKQELKYDKDSGNITEYKEYHCNQLIIHAQKNSKGQSYKAFYDDVYVHEEWDNQHRNIITTLPLSFDLTVTHNKKIIPYNNPSIKKHYYKAYFVIDKRQTYDRNGVAYPIETKMKLVLHKKLNDTHIQVITKYLDKQ
jgi:hypothetical protein